MSGMGSIVCLNKLSNVDKVFFIVCAVIIALIVAVYFLIPVINRKFYNEQRENLRKREASFKTNFRGGANGGEAQPAEDDLPETETSEVENTDPSAE